jgi:uncharacterized membrane protein YhaH (DUF805 family)
MDYLFSLNGRLNRSKYWMAIIVYIIADVVGNLLSMLLGTVGIVLLALISLAVLVSAVLVARQRLHDRDKSGWWLLLFYFGPSILVGLGTAFFLVFGGGVIGSVLGTILSLAGIALVIWAIVELGFLRGTVGMNRYGPDPLAPVAVVTV